MQMHSQDYKKQETIEEERKHLAEGGGIASAEALVY